MSTAELLFVVMVLCKPEGIAGLWQAAQRRAGALRRSARLAQEGVAHGPV